MSYPEDEATPILNEDGLDVTGVLAFGTSLIGLGTVGLVSLLQIIGLLT